MPARKSRKASNAEPTRRGDIDVQEAKWDQALQLSASIMESIDEAERKGLEPSESEIAAVARRVKEARRALRGLEEALSGVIITPTTLAAAAAPQSSRQAGQQPQEGAMRKPTQTRQADAASYGPPPGAQAPADDRYITSAGLQAKPHQVAASRAPIPRPPAGYVVPSLRPDGSSPMPGGSEVRSGQRTPLYTAVPGPRDYLSKTLQSSVSLLAQRPAGGAMRGAAATPPVQLRPGAATAGGPALGTTLQSIPLAPPPPEAAVFGSVQMAGGSRGVGHPRMPAEGSSQEEHGAMGGGMGQGRGMHTGHQQDAGGGMLQQQQKQQQLSWGVQSSPLITPPAASTAGSSQSQGKGGREEDPWTAHGSAGSAQENDSRDSWMLPEAASKRGRSGAGTTIASQSGAHAEVQGKSMHVATTSG